MSNAPAASAAATSAYVWSRPRTELLRPGVPEKWMSMQCSTPSRRGGYLAHPASRSLSRAGSAYGADCSTSVNKPDFAAYPVSCDDGHGTYDPLQREPSRYARTSVVGSSL